MHVCIYTRVHIYTCTTYTYAHARVYTCMSIHTCLCVHIDARAHVCVYTYACTGTYMCARACLYVRAHTGAYVIVSDRSTEVTFTPFSNTSPAFTQQYSVQERAGSIGRCHPLGNPEY